MEWTLDLPVVPGRYKVRYWVGDKLASYWVEVYRHPESRELYIRQSPLTTWKGSDYEWYGPTSSPVAVTELSILLEYLGRAVDSNYPKEVPMVLLTLFRDGSGQISGKKPDPGHSLTEQEATLWNRKFHNYREGAEALLDMPSATAPTEVSKDFA